MSYAERQALHDDAMGHPDSVPIEEQSIPSENVLARRIEKLALVAGAVAALVALAIHLHIL